jgi:hypothetical protein
MGILRLRKARAERRTNHNLVMAYDDHNRLILLIKHCKNERDLSDMEYEVDQFCIIYGELISMRDLHNLSQRMEDHLTIRRCMIK